MTKKNIFITVLTSLFIFLSIILITYIILSKLNQNKEIKYFNYFLMNNGKEGEKTYLNIKSISNAFAKDNKNGYYFASDGDYNYIVYLNEKKLEELLKKDLDEEKVQLYGVTKVTSDEVKKIALEKYNISSDKKITINEYSSYFGNLYLDLVNVK